MLVMPSPIALRLLDNLLTLLIGIMLALVTAALVGVEGTAVSTAYEYVLAHIS